MKQDKKVLSIKALVARYSIIAFVTLLVVFFSRGGVIQEPLFVERSISCSSLNKIKALIGDIVSYRNQELIAIFDIDETLVRRSGTQDGGSEWFTQSIYYLQKTRNLSFKEARNVVYPLYKKYLTLTPIVLMDNRWHDIFNMLKKRAIPVIALTRRSAELSRFTIESLEGLGLTFSERYLGPDSSVQLSKELAIHLKGALFSGLNTKDETLEYFMTKRHQERPFLSKMVILYVDNSELHLESVSRALHTFAEKNEIAITLYAVHYKNLQHIAFEMIDRHKAELEEAYDHFVLSKGTT